MIWCSLFYKVNKARKVSRREGKMGIYSYLSLKVSECRCVYCLLCLQHACIRVNTEDPLIATLISFDMPGIRKATANAQLPQLCSKRLY